MLLQATYFSTINPQFVGLLTHILRPPTILQPRSTPHVKNLGSVLVCFRDCFDTQTDITRLMYQDKNLKIVSISHLETPGAIFEKIWLKSTLFIEHPFLKFQIWNWMTLFSYYCFYPTG